MNKNDSTKIVKRAKTSKAASVHPYLGTKTLKVVEAIKIKKNQGKSKTDFFLDSPAPSPSLFISF